MTFFNIDLAAMITYDFGANGHYISKNDRITARLPILRQSTKRVGVENGGTSEGTHVTRLPFKQFLNAAAKADTF